MALIVLLVFCVHHHFVSSASNPVLKEFEENRETYIANDHKRIMKELNNARDRMAHDPSLGFPVVVPEGDAAKMVRHILIYNRLSPPNSLRAAEFSAKNEFYVWLDNSPGRGCSIEITLKVSTQRIYIMFILKPHFDVDL